MTVNTLSGYFLNHSVGLFPDQQQLIQNALSEYAAAWCDPVDGQWDYLLQARGEFLGHWASLLNVDSNSLCSMDNVTTAVYSLLGSLPRSALDERVVLIAENCFPSLHFLLDGLQDRFGFRLRTVRNDHPHFTSDQAYIEAWDEEVGLAILTWVGSTTSSRIDLQKMAAHARRMGSLTFADITQGAGIIPIDLEALDLDFAATTSLKWTGGSPGAGILYVNEERLDACQPELRGWFSQSNPFSWDLDAFVFSETTDRFLNGTPSLLPCCASLPGLRWLHSVGQETIFNHNRHLTALMIDHAQQKGWRLLTPCAEHERGGSLMFEVPQAVSPDAVLADLGGRSFAADARGQILRLSPGITTTEDAVEQLCAVLDDYLV